MPHSVAVIAFDLDDTLLNTSGSLVLQHAIQESCTAMIEAGLACDLKTCIQRREEEATRLPHEDLYDLMARAYAPKERRLEIAAIGRKAFYERDIKEPLELFSGSLDLLKDLAQRYRLFLVSAGSEYTQNQKIDRLQISGFFEKIYICDHMDKNSKCKAFAAITRVTALPSDQHLSVGNRLDTDIRSAQQLGWKTCWVRQGEHQNQRIEDHNDNPDFEIFDIRDLIGTCQL